MGGCYVGKKVLLDIECGELWNRKWSEERNGYGKLYLRGKNIEGGGRKDLIDNVEDWGEIRKSD